MGCERCKELEQQVERLKGIEKLELMESEALSDTLKRAEKVEAQISNMIDLNHHSRVEAELSECQAKLSRSRWGKRKLLPEERDIDYTEKKD